MNVADHIWSVCRLYGFSTLQTYIYYDRSRGDSLIFKGLVSEFVPSASRADDRPLTLMSGRHPLVRPRTSLQRSLALKTVGPCRTLDTLHTILISHVVYTFAITDYGNVLSLVKPEWYAPPLFYLHVSDPDV